MELTMYNPGIYTGRRIASALVNLGKALSREKDAATARESLGLVGDRTPELWADDAGFWAGYYFRLCDVADVSRAGVILEQARAAGDTGGSGVE